MNSIFTSQTRDSAKVLSTLLVASATNGAVRLVCTGFYSFDMVRSASSAGWLIEHMSAGFDNPF